MEWLNVLNSDQRLTVLVAVLSTLLGGGVSLATSYFLAKSARSFDLKEKQKTQLEQRAFYAQKAIIKLFELGNSSISIKMHIDEQFDEADAAGDSGLEPVQKVQEIVSGNIKLETLLPEEIAFLLHTNESDLLMEILVFEKRVISHQAVVSAYNKYRAELTELMSSGLVSAQGKVATVELKGTDGILANVKISALNNLLGQFMEKLDRDSIDAISLLNRFSSVAKKTFGEHFPTLVMEAPKC